MPNQTHAQLLTSISLIKREVDFTVPDKLSHFSKRMLEELEAQVAISNKKLQRDLEDLKYKYAATTPDGTIIEIPPVYNETLGIEINFQIPEDKLVELEAEGTIIIETVQETEVEIAEIICPPCPRIATLSTEFLENFIDTLIPLSELYGQADFTSFAEDLGDPSGCFYTVPVPKTIYRSLINDLYYQFNNVIVGENTVADTGYYFINESEYFHIVDGEKSTGVALSCIIG